MQYGVFLTQALAQSASNAIYTAMTAAGLENDVMLSTSQIITPRITNGWMNPIQRKTDGLWVVAINPAVTAVGQTLWTIQTGLTSWF